MMLLKIKYLWTCLVLLCSYASIAQVKLCSWNISNLGKKKTTEQINTIANIIQAYDLIAIQEVVSGADGGPIAVRSIIKALNQRGNHWKYTISEPTTSSNPHEVERYAFIFKSSKVQLLQKISYPSWLKDSIVREPYAVQFQADGISFIAVNYHAIPKKKQPQREIKWFKWFPTYLKEKNLIFLADFNVSDEDNVFNPLKRLGFTSAISKQSTTLKTVCIQENCLANPYDNIFFPTFYWDMLDAGIIHFYRQYNYNMTEARKLSDHCPVFITLKSK